MKIVSRIAYNFFAFALGLLFTWAIVFVTSKAGFMTANIADALPTSRSSSNDIVVNRVWGKILVTTANSFAITSWESLRAEFHYNTDLQTESWSLDSPYPHSFVLTDWLMTVILRPWTQNILTNQTLFEINTSLEDEQSLPIIDSLIWYGDWFAETLSISTNNTIHY